MVLPSASPLGWSRMVCAPPMLVRVPVPGFPAPCYQAPQAPTLSGLPSLGSAGHHLGQCQPCAFTAKGCNADKECRFCHLCDVDEHKRRKQEKKTVKRVVEQARRSMG